MMLHHPYNLILATNYRDNDSAIAIRSTVNPTTLLLVPPSLNISITRKLFRQRSEQGTLSVNISQRPTLALNFVSPDRFDFGIPSFSPLVDHFEPGDSPKAPSVSGLRTGTSQKTCGFVLDARDPKIVGDWTIAFPELSFQLKTGLELGILGLSWVFSGSWVSKTSEVSATTYLNRLGVVLKLELVGFHPLLSTGFDNADYLFRFAYWEQRLTLPLVLSQEYSPLTAFWTVVLPSSALVLGYHLVLKPRRRAQRLA